MSLADFEFKIAHMLTPLFVLVTALIVGKLVLYFVDSLAAMMIFKVKGYRLHDNVRINGEIATITKIGLWTTNFELANGDLMIEFLAVSNTRLDFMTVRRLVPKVTVSEPKG